MSSTARPSFRPAVEQLDDRLVPSGGINPVYTATFDNAVTADNAFTAGGKRYYDIDAGADDYNTDQYERPTAQTYQVRTQADGTQRFAAEEYLSNLNIVRARAGFDATYLYVSIELAGRSKLTADGKATVEGLVYRYGFRLATDPQGKGGLLVVADQPGLKNASAAFGSQATFVYRDGNWDVGGTGLTVTKQTRSAEANGNGYDSVLASDGRTGAGKQVVWTRVNPATPNTVELVLDYKTLGLTEANLRALPYLEFEANKGLQDPANYLWNDEYNRSEAGSPYRAATGDRTKSIYGTQGLGNIYELDTARGGPVVDERPGSVGGYAYADANRDGDRDAGEPGLAGVAVTLTGTDVRGAAVTRTAATGADGGYAFADLLPGTYAVAAAQPAGLDDGAESVGTIDGTPVGTVTGNDAIGGIVLGPAKNGVEYNFGELEPVVVDRPASVAGFVYFDLDESTTRDPGEPGLADVLITLTGTDAAGDAVTRQTVTGADGSYRFGDLRPGTYTLTQTHPDGVRDGMESAGTINGVTVGFADADAISGIVLGAGDEGVEYNFGEFQE